MYSSLRTC